MASNLAARRKLHRHVLVSGGRVLRYPRPDQLLFDPALTPDGKCPQPRQGAEADDGDPERPAFHAAQPTAPAAGPPLGAIGEVTVRVAIARSVSRCPSTRRR